MRPPVDAVSSPSEPRRGRRRLWFLAAAGAVVGVGGLIAFDLYRVVGPSMAPTLIGASGGGDRVVADATAYWRRAPVRWELTVFAPPGERATHVKRIVGVPGDVLAIRDGDVWVSGVRLEKPASVAAAMLIPVFDSSDSPIGSPAFAGDWLVENATADGTRFTAIDAERPITVTARHEVTDSLDGFLGGAHAVGDLHVSVTVRVPVGARRLDLTLGDRFSQTTCTLLSEGLSRISQDGSVRADLTARLAVGREQTIQLSNIDGRVECTIDGETAATFEEDGSRGPTKSGRSNGIRLSWSGSSDPFDLVSLRVRRDVHYLSEGLGGNEPVTVPPDHYFLLGDNSPRSEDSRKWGPVPAGRLVGAPIGILWPPARIRRL